MINIFTKEEEKDQIISALMSINELINNGMFQLDEETEQDMLDCGAIEQDADQVIFIYRDAYYNKNSNDLSCKVLLAKNRHGETGSVDITFRGELCKFTDNTNENFGL